MGGWGQQVQWWEPPDSPLSALGGSSSCSSSTPAPSSTFPGTNLWPRPAQQHHRSLRIIQRRFKSLGQDMRFLWVLTPKVGRSKEWTTGSGYHSVIYCFFPQLVGKGRRHNNRVLPFSPLQDRDTRLWRCITWRRGALPSRRRVCRTVCFVGCLWRSRLDAQRCVRCEAERVQRTRELRLSEALPRETLDKRKGRQGGMAPGYVLHNAAQRSVSREALAHGLAGRQPNLR